MQPIQQPQEDFNGDILVDATLEQNQKLDELNDTNEIQAEGVIKTNEKLDDLNSSLDLILEKMTEEKVEELTKDDISKIIELLTQIKDKDFEVEISVNGVEIESITSEEINEEED